MKNIFLLIPVAALAVLAACSGSGKKETGADTLKAKDTADKIDTSVKKYNIKSGIIHMESVSEKRKQKTTMYFDDYGDKVCRETSGDVSIPKGGITKIHTMTINKDGNIVNIDLIKKTGRKIKNLRKRQELNFNNMTAGIMKEMGITESGTDTVMGKTCKKFTVNDTVKKVNGTYYIWNGIPLKTEMIMMGVKVVNKAVSIEENAKLPEGIFDIPKDIKIAGGPVSPRLKRHQGRKKR